MKLKVSTLLKTTAAVTGIYLVAGEVIYERLLNKKFTGINNKTRKITPELNTYYDNAEHVVDGDAWFVTHHTEETQLVNSKGKTMYCNIFRQKEYTDRWIIIIHGYTSAPRGMAEQAYHFYKKGFNVLLPSLVSFGSDKNNYCTMGYHDRYYVKDWINYIVNLDNNASIVVMGESMGSATTMLVTGEEDLPSNVKCAVADCGYTSCWDEYACQAKEMFNLPSFPLMNAANTVSKLRGNFDFKKCSPIKAVAKSKTPTLFVHGEKDTFVPYWMMNKLFDACVAEKEKLSVPDALHAESCYVHPDLYFSTVDNFIERYI